jgi:hypothetical protein
MNAKLLLVFLFLSALACRKSEALQADGVFQRNLIFSSAKEAKDQIEAYLHEHYPTEKLYSVGNISYIHTSTRTMAIVFYQTNTGEHNMLFEKNDSNTESISNRVTVCEGSSCNCKVTAVIDNRGNVTIDCNCSSCAMISTEL